MICLEERLAYNSRVMIKVSLNPNAGPELAPLVT